MRGTIYVDTSFDKGVCQTGYIIDIGGENLTGYSPIFDAENNNDAEIMGILIACKMAKTFYEYYDRDHEKPYYLTVYNDSITATTVADSKYVPKPKAKGKYASTKAIQSWCAENNVTIKCNRMKRSNIMIKKCDRLSKMYRKKGKTLNGRY